MKVIIELDTGLLEGIRESDFDFARSAVRNFQATVADSIRSGIPIPNNATNGDVIKLMFPNDSRCFISVNMDRNDWWNAPYKAESEDIK